jgi:hypothetical protein
MLCSWSTSITNAMNISFLIVSSPSARFTAVSPCYLITLCLKTEPVGSPSISVTYFGLLVRQISLAVQNRHRVRFVNLSS